jgi:rfaE bifunctional protein kinase chain/domain
MSVTFHQKIKSCEAIAEIIGRRPRAKTVVMCHGTFDIVHPGHLRHLMYAREKADLLIASVTADAQITKANYRPYVPEELRATNLAALEIVDWVFIDPHPTPVENILALQPDYFAKGYEYLSNGVASKTRDEVAAVKSYGGEMLFTPGDIVYSSSALMEEQLPKIEVDKLVILMQSEKIGFGDLRRTLRQLEGIRVHLVGDTIVDHYSYCSLLGATAKSPTFSVRYQRTEHFAGGAAAVARHMRAAQARVTLSTVLGDDPAKEFVVQAIAGAGVELLPVIDKMRPTTQKERFFAEGQKMLQVDRVDNRAIGESTVQALASALQGHEADVVVFSDFRHGIFNRETVERLKAAIPPGALRVADSQVSNRWGNILEFTDFDLLTPNEREARFALGDQDSVIRPLALKLFREARCRALILKLGERGILGYRSPGPMPREFFTVDSFVDVVSDPIGAGDALLAYASLALRATDSIVIAAILGSIAAAVECERQGNLPVTPAEVEQKIGLLEKLANYT